MCKKSLYKTLNSIFTRTFFFVINGIQSKVFSISIQLYQQFPQLFEKILLCQIIHNLFAVIVMLLH